MKADIEILRNGQRSGTPPAEVLQQLFDLDVNPWKLKGKAFIGVEYKDEHGQMHGSHKWVEEKYMKKREYDVYQSSIGNWSIIVVMTDELFCEGEEIKPLTDNFTDIQGNPKRFGGP